MKIKDTILIAGAILVASAILALGKFENSNLIVSTIMVVIAIGLLVIGYRKDNGKLSACLKKRPSNHKVVGITLMVVLVFFGLGFSVGKLIYLWSQQM
ncbi:hypothetical protein [Allomuricauda sp. d1]|uniref:hypothetical protein n=1 Tax=Allomuricauda sp. d1 TaxID=3136725 RepID=UPI0031D01F2C